MPFLTYQITTFLKVESQYKGQQGKSYLCVAQLVKNLPAMQETWVKFLGLQDSLEKRKATHSSILAWRIPWTEEPVQLHSMGSQRVRQD